MPGNLVKVDNYHQYRKVNNVVIATELYSCHCIISLSGPTVYVMDRAGKPRAEPLLYQPEPFHKN